jgi:hypothetical protein
MVKYVVPASKAIDELLATIRGLPVPDRLRLVEYVVHDIALDESVPQDSNPRSVIGSFADVADVMQDVCEAAMVARERDPLRLSNG